MALRIMISGPHGIGKSTTAKAIAKEIPELLYVPSIAGTVAARVGYDLNANPPLEDVAAYQETLRKALNEHLAITAQTLSIYDRSPLDLAIYTTLKLRDSDEHEEQLCEYVNKCFESIEKHCDILIIPLADVTESYEYKENRPKFNEEQIMARKEYYELLEAFVETLSNKVKVLYVPVEYQFEARTEYIIQKLKGM